MKAFYKIIIFFAIFHFAVIIVNSLGVFPDTLYSDVEMQEISELEGPIDFIKFMFPLPDFAGFSEFQSYFTFGMLAFLFLTFGAVFARATHSWTPVIVVILATSFVPMVLNSYSFFSRVFYNWDVPALTYLAITLGIGIVLIAILTIIETPTHGRSGS